MYSLAWFESFAESIPESRTLNEASAISKILPRSRFEEILDVGCGTGRLTAGLENLGYRVTGIDISTAALVAARKRAPRARLVALDQVHVGRLPWSFDAAVIAWNSLGFGSRSSDLDLFLALEAILCPGGRLLLDLYHPPWLEGNQHRDVEVAPGVIADRWLEDGRCFHRFQYPDGSVDRIEFNVYHPEEMESVGRSAGLEVERVMTWWSEKFRPGSDVARYQMVMCRPR